MGRKEKKYHFIYKTTNVLTNRYYIGIHSTNNLDDGYLGSGRRLQYSVNKYGAENHKREVIEFLLNRKSLLEKETEIVNLNEIAKKDCMNLKIGGEGGFISDEQQRHRSSCAGKAQAKKMKTDENHRKMVCGKISKAIKLNWKRGIYNNWKNDGFTNKNHTEESKRKIGIANSIKQRGENNSQYGTCWITNGLENKKIKRDGLIPLKWYLGRTMKT